MGGSNKSAATSQPLGSGYNSALMKSLQLSNGVTNAAISMRPELESFDLDFLQKGAYREALINALNSKATEEELTPDVARTRAGLSKAVADDLEGGPSTALSNQWLKQGLIDQIATGTRSDSGFARSAIVDSTRSDYKQDRDQQEAKAAGLLSANPMPVVGLDPGALASARMQTNSNNSNTMNSWKSGILGLLGNQAQNTTGALQQWMQTVAAERANKTAAQNASTGSSNALFGTLLGSGLGAAGAIGGGVLVAF